MSYVRWSSKVVQDCKVCHNEGWVALLPEHPEWLTWGGHIEGGDRDEPMPRCCVSCWYIYCGSSGLVLYHAKESVCPTGYNADIVLATVEQAKEWSPPESCPHGQMALDCVNEWISEEEGSGA